MFNRSFGNLFVLRAVWLSIILERSITIFIATFDGFLKRPGLTDKAMSSYTKINGKRYLVIFVNTDYLLACFYRLW